MSLSRAELIVATRNRGKLVELQQALSGVRARVVDLTAAGIPLDPAEDVLEDDSTFEGNALAKARHFFARAGGRAVLSDDSGLVVRALAGAPGVRSRRYAGATGSEAEVAAANTVLLLSSLAGVHDRRASFTCALALVTSAGTWTATGHVDGHILTAPRGSRGFGYDPVFWCRDLARTFGESSDLEKAAVSHRSRALAALLAVVPRRVWAGGCG